MTDICRDKLFALFCKFLERQAVRYGSVVQRSGDRDNIAVTDNANLTEPSHVLNNLGTNSGADGVHGNKQV